MIDSYSVGDWTLTADSVTFQGRPIPLTPTHFAILASLISHPNELHTPRRMMTVMESRAFDLKVVDVQLCTLRRGLRQNGFQKASEQIETVWGRGVVLRPTGNPYALDERYVARWTPNLKRSIYIGLQSGLFSGEFREINMITDEELTEWKAAGVLDKR